MPLPASVTTVVVAGEFMDKDGTPATGRVTFEMPYPLRDADGNVIVGAGIFEADIDEDGQFVIELIATDDPDITPQGWVYAVTVSTSVWRERFSVEIPYDSVGPLAFAALTPVEVPPEVATYATVIQLAEHAADATDVHGIADTAALETITGAAAQIAAHSAASDPHGDRAFTTAAIATHSAASDPHGDRAAATAAIAAHEADTTSVHGIADTANLVLTNDSRLSDARTPTPHASSHGSLGSDPVTLAQSQITGLATSLDAKVDVTGDTMTGALTVNASSGSVPPPYGTTAALNTGVNVVSSYAGGDDDGVGTDSTGRLNLYSFQRANTNSFGETIRHFLMKKDAKAMEAWYFPDGGYDGSRNPVGNWKPVVWAGAHWEANNHLSNHKHWSVEVPDSTGAIQTRFEVRFGDPTVDNAISGLDKTLVMTNLADLVVRCSNGQELRLSAPAGTQKSLMFSNDSEGGSASRRWLLRSTSTAESGANAGSDFQLVRYDDTGTLVDAPIAVTRSSGQVQLGPTGGVLISRSSGAALSVNPGATGGQAILVTGTDATARAYQGQVSGDGTIRSVVYVDGKIEMGSGSASRDTNLYRNSADQLKTDDSFVVGTRLAVGQSLGTDTISSTSDGTIAAGFFKASADGTASVGVLKIETNTTAKRALDIRLTGDSVSRLRVDTSASGNPGTIVFGNGTTADTNLYRSTTDTLKTDDSFVVGGNLTVTGDLATLGTINAKGDLLVGTANDTLARLGVGANGKVLTADSSVSGGMDWSPAPAPTIPGAASQVGNYFVMGMTPVSTQALTGSYQVLYLFPYYAPPGTAVDRIALEVTAAGTGVVRQGIYSNDPATGLPVVTSALYDFGTVDVTGATGIRETTISATLPGWHWYGLVWQTDNTTAPTLRIMTQSFGIPSAFNLASSAATSMSAGRYGYFATGVSGALGAITIGGPNQIFPPRLAYRRA